MYKRQDLCCILLALAVSGMVTIAPDLSVFDDYTGASLFTIFFYLLFFYILDAYSVGMEDFKDTLGRILVACVLGIISSATASFALENWRFDRVTVLLLFALSFVFCLGWRFLYYLNADKLTHPLRVLLVGVDRGGKVRKLLAEGLPKALSLIHIFSMEGAYFPEDEVVAAFRTHLTPDMQGKLDVLDMDGWRLTRHVFAGGQVKSSSAPLNNVLDYSGH